MEPGYESRFKGAVVLNACTRVDMFFGTVYYVFYVLLKSETLQVMSGPKAGLSKGSAVGYTSLLTFVILALAWFVGFASRLFAIVRFESIIHEFDPWLVS